MLENIFSNIYINKKWQDNYGTTSGPGSSIECSESYLVFLKRYCESNNIQSILDLGCGDFNLMRYFNFTGETYLGIDIVSFVIENNELKYGNDNIKFINMSLLDYTFDIHFDLIVIKDVFQHLSKDSIKHILNNIKNSNHILITNDFIEDNVDILDGGYTPINLTNDPFNILGDYIFEWQSCNHLKKTFKLKL